MEKTSRLFTKRVRVFEFEAEDKPQAVVREGLEGDETACSGISTPFKYHFYIVKYF